MELKSLQPDVDALVTTTIQDCLDGELIETHKDTSYEVLHYQTGLTNPAARIMVNPARPLNIVVAVARWVWLMAGNDRVEDIAYYEPKVRGFSDNGLTVPGSCYGARLFNSQPGIDQIAGVIDRLSKDSGSRQASAVVWQPHDAVRNSNDIPCTHGMFFHIRDGLLDMCVTMRSNNAFRILPFNVFEFTMLQEVVAKSLGVPMGDYVHWAASMHVYKNEREWDATREVVHNEHHDSIVMSPMPSEDVRYQCNLLCQLEGKLRHAATPSEFVELEHMAKDLLHPYWADLFRVLYCYSASRHHLNEQVWFENDYLSQLTLAAINKRKA